jgi:hypothetical protein
MRKGDGLDGEMEASKEKMRNRGRLDETRLSPSLRDEEEHSTWTGRRDAIEINWMVRCNRHRLDDEVPSRSAIKINATAKSCNQGQMDDEMATRSKGCTALLEYQSAVQIKSDAVVLQSRSAGCRRAVKMHLPPRNTAEKTENITIKIKKSI